MAYSGRYSIKNASKYKGDANNIIYRSLWEKAVFQWCDKNPKVKQWSSEEIVIPYYYEVDKKYHRYFVDVKIAVYICLYVLFCSSRRPSSFVLTVMLL